VKERELKKPASIHIKKKTGLYGVAAGIVVLGACYATLAKESITPCAHHWRICGHGPWHFYWLRFVK
jgi:hypothetical protein